MWMHPNTAMLDWSVFFSLLKRLFQITVSFFYILQRSVAMQLRYGVIFSDHIIANFPLRVLAKYC